MDTMRARACGERTKAHQASPSQVSSSAYRPLPVRSRASSTRGSRRPIYIASLRIALEAARGAQRIELAHDLASVAAAARAHQLDEEFRAVGERRLERVEAPALVARRLGGAAIEALPVAEGQREIEARLRRNGSRAQRWVERH